MLPLKVSRPWDQTSRVTRGAERKDLQDISVMACRERLRMLSAEDDGIAVHGVSVS